VNKPIKRLSDQEALRYHASGKPGKLEIVATKPVATQRDLSLAYSPGVAVPVRAIAENPASVYDYTAKGNLVAVISNGTAILGLGNLGALAAKPVMEGKAVLFKRFADVDSIDIEVDTEDVDAFVNCVRYLGPSFGGINLEDIKAPECFIIEQRLREIMTIPVFHDDQHGTAIITTAGLLNALDLTGRSIKNTRLVVNGAGAAAIACLELMKAVGLPHDNAILCDSKGVIYQGRDHGMNQWKSAHAADTKLRTLKEAMKGADVFLGLSIQGSVTPDMVKGMAKKPVIFALANPDPEITPEEVENVRSDAIMATGRSDYPNQVNNVLGFPYIFRGALDVRASQINDAMKIAAAEALAALAREDVPDEVASAYGDRPHYGPKYIIPVPFDPRLISRIPPAVAEAAMASGVARHPIIDMDAYRTTLSARLNPTAASLQMIFDRVRANPRRVVFAEGEESRTIRAAAAFRSGGYGIPVLIGRVEHIQETLTELGFEGTDGFEIHNARLSTRNQDYVDYLYGRLQRKGFLRRDCERLVNNARNVFAACMVALGDADAMVTGLTRNYWGALNEVRHAIDPKPEQMVFGLSILVTGGRTVFVADTTVHARPSSDELAQIAEQAAGVARQFGHVPRVGLISFSNFGNPEHDITQHIERAIELLDERKLDFEYDGEMSIDVALDFDLMKRLYPFSRLSGPANVLVMPGLHAANAAATLIPALNSGKMIGPLLIGLSRPVQISQMGSSTSDLVNMAALAAHDAIR
jgi:malate dehydrogenase (oxaloacetate-decarboxylating)(NADP+)